MTILKIIETLQIYSEDFIAYKLDGQFANAVTEAVALLIGQGERITELEEQNRWVPVTEKMPENFVSVLGYIPASAPFPPVRECYTVGDCFYFPALQDTQLVSHWKPMPEPPKEENDG